MSDPTDAERLNAERLKGNCPLCGCLKIGHHPNGCEGAGGNCGCTRFWLSYSQRPRTSMDAERLIREARSWDANLDCNLKTRLCDALEEAIQGIAKLTEENRVLRAATGDKVR